MSGVTVRVPATSANLGSGYDSFGLALGLYNTVSAGLSVSGSWHVQAVRAVRAAMNTQQAATIKRRHGMEPAEQSPSPTGRGETNKEAKP